MASLLSHRNLDTPAVNVSLTPFPMNRRLLSATILCVCITASGTFGADEQPPAPKKQATKEEIQARLAEHARKRALGETAAAATAASTATTSKSPSPAATATGAPVATTTSPAPGSTPGAAAAPAQEPAKVLPKVEVRKGRVTELDRQLEKQNQEIAREKKNTKPTALDDTLNGSKVSSALAIFGGQSSEDRSTIAKERVAMMEEERDMIEAIAQANTKEEKEELQKTLDSMREMRRELEKSLH